MKSADKKITSGPQTYTHDVGMFRPCHNCRHRTALPHI